MRVEYVLAKVTVDGENHNFVSGTKSNQSLKKEGSISPELMQTARRVSAEEKGVTLTAKEEIIFDLFGSEGKLKSGVFRGIGQIKVYPNSIAI